MRRIGWVLLCIGLLVAGRSIWLLQYWKNMSDTSQTRGLISSVLFSSVAIIGAALLVFNRQKG